MRLGNLALRAGNLDQVAEFFEQAAGCSVKGRHVLDRQAFLELEMGGVTVNAFNAAIYESSGRSSLADGWLHMSFFVEDLDQYLSQPEWQRVLLWGPQTIHGHFGSRRIAFFEPAPGARVELMQNVGSADVDPFAELAAAGATTVYEAAGQRGAMTADIRAMGSGRAIAGRAITVRCAPGDNLGVHEAVAAAQTGDVLVVDGHGVEVGYLGDILAIAAQARGIQGAVVAGGVRDLAGLEELGFEVWARGPAIRAASKQRSSELGVPIVCGGVLVEPGDIVVADRDGVTVIEARRIDKVVEQARDRLRREELLRDQITGGALTLDLLGLR